MTKNAWVFPPFTDGFTRQKANHFVFFEQFKVCRYNFSGGIYRRTRKQQYTKKKTEKKVALLEEFFRLKDESRPAEEITLLTTQTRDIQCESTKNHPLDVAKKYVETYSTSNAAAQDPEERVRLINIQQITLQDKLSHTKITKEKACQPHLH